MNILGHSYIATRAVSAGKRDLLIVGALLPESFPFIEGNPFSFEEIHEGGEIFLKFLDKNYPEERDLAMGMLAHSKGFGADRFNKEIEKFAGSQREELLGKIAACSGIDSRIAEYRLHNFLWWGVDIWILREHPKLVREVQNVLGAVDVEGVSRLLAETFGKEQTGGERTMRTLFGEIYRPRDLDSVEGLARTWARQAAGLSEKDRVDVLKATEVIKECAGLLENDWRNVLGMVETRVDENLRPFIEREGVRRKNKEQEI